MITTLKEQKTGHFAFESNKKVKTNYCDRQIWWSIMWITGRKLYEKIETQANKEKTIDMEKSQIENASRIMRKVIYN